MKESYVDLRHKLVVKANDLIQKSRFNMTLQQQKMVLFLISQVTPFDEDFKVYEFSTQEFCSVCGIDTTSGKHYKAIKQCIKDIADVSVWVKTNTGEETLLRWIEKPYINSQTGRIKVRLDEDMKPFLLQLKENFTKYELIYTLCFKSKYTIRLYELIKSLHFNDLEEYRRTFTVDELRIALGGETYKEYRDFKRRVLDVAVKEINEYSDKTLSYETIRKGRAVIGIELIISSKDAMETIKIVDLIERDLGTDQLTLFEMMREAELKKQPTVIEFPVVVPEDEDEDVPFDEFDYDMSIE